MATALEPAIREMHEPMPVMLDATSPDGTLCASGPSDRCGG